MKEERFTELDKDDIKRIIHVDSINGLMIWNQNIVNIDSF